MTGPASQNGARVEALGFSEDQLTLIAGLRQGHSPPRDPRWSTAFDQPTALGALPLTFLVAVEDAKAIRLAIAAGADPYLSVPERGSALTLAAQRSTIALRALLDAGCDPDARLDRPLIQTAGASSRYDNVRLLAERGADMNACADNGDTLLLMALFQGDLELASLALDLGTNPRIGNRFGVTPEALVRDQLGHAASQPRGTDPQRLAALQSLAERIAPAAFGRPPVA